MVTTTEKEKENILKLKLTLEEKEVMLLKEADA